MFSRRPCIRLVETYEWIQGVDPATTAIADAPDWLIDICRDDTPGASAGGAPPPPGGDFNDFGRRIDGRERYMRDLLWARLIEERRTGPLPLTDGVLERSLPSAGRYSSGSAGARGEPGQRPARHRGNGSQAELCDEEMGYRIAAEATKPKPNGTWEETPEPQGASAPKDDPDTEHDPRPPAFTDEPLALQFAELHADDLRYVAAWGKWLPLDGAGLAVRRHAGRVRHGSRCLPGSGRGVQQAEDREGGCERKNGSRGRTPGESRSSPRRDDGAMGSRPVAAQHAGWRHRPSTPEAGDRISPKTTAPRSPP